MAFDFNNSRNRSESGNSSNGSSSFNNLPQPGRRRNTNTQSEGTGGFSNIPHPSNGNNNSGSFGKNYSSNNTNLNGNNSGFQQKPGMRGSDTSRQQPIGPAEPIDSRIIRAPKKPRITRNTGRGTGMPSIPWNIIIPLLGIVLVVAFLWIYRAAITAFLMDLLTWVIIVIIVIALFKWFIFGGRRR